MFYFGTYPISFLDFLTLSREKRQTAANNGVLPSGTKLSKRARKLNNSSTNISNSNRTGKSNESGIPRQILQPKKVETKNDGRGGERFYHLTNTPFSDLNLLANGIPPPALPAPSTVMTGTTYIEPPPQPYQHDMDDIHKHRDCEDGEEEEEEEEMEKEEQRNFSNPAPIPPTKPPHLSTTKTTFVTLWLNDLLRHGGPAALEVYWHSDFQQAQRDVEAEGLPPDLTPDLTVDASSTCSPTSSFGDELCRTGQVVWPSSSRRRRSSVGFDTAAASVASIETLVLPPPEIDFRDPWRDGFASVGRKVRLSRGPFPGLRGGVEEWGRLLFAKEAEDEDEEVVRVRVVGFEEPVVYSGMGRNEGGRVGRMQRCALAAHRWPVGIPRTLD
ncbi:hypothetical protein KC343_g2713 [Hortaea werneckii]|nr:hypothetical protein KC352_g15463 [Hortaea werneckii]KAI7568049.1 hypothetical protein KC317_g4536 [Hortaea werneckii]KAI7611630.1 hypothetical protein KC346_g8196 [Hortaea werneckii]KAI7633816.1 hypothetical protein KC343_g2713 [Hortaea werneckii]KAI7664408.1 hypothetical protein KC319_g7489 [Hortaea werneckii]